MSPPLDGMAVVWPASFVEAALLTDLGVGRVRVHEDRVTLRRAPLDGADGGGGDPVGGRGR